MAKAAFFDRGFFEFLSQLARNNNREWFQANKARYESDIRDPMLLFLAALGPRLHKFAPHFVVDPSPVGGSMMRIYRDIRFARDKSPYKTAVAAHFQREGRKGESVPVYYLYLAPGKSSLGAGIWHPDPKTLRGVRDAMVRDPKRWQRITSKTTFGSSCGMVGESLKRVPSGYDADSPVADDLKRKDLGIAAPITDSQVVGSGVLDTVVDAYRAFSPFMAFLCETAGVTL